MDRNLKYSASFTTATGGLYLREVNAILPYIMSTNTIDCSTMKFMKINSLELILKPRENG
jgi:hypothetical protein